MADRSLNLDPIPDETLDSLWNRLPKVAEVLEEALDWTEADPPDVRAKRRRFSNGMWVITRMIAGDEWLIVWEEPEPDRPVVRHTGESISL